MENLNNTSRIGRKGYRIVFLLSLSISLLFECLIFIYTQINKIDFVLKQDFRVMAIKSADGDESKIYEDLKKINGVKSVNFVPSSEILKKIELEDKELYYSISSLGKKPVPDIYELEVDDYALGNMDSFVDNLLKLKGVEDVKYKILESYAIMHFSFYSNFVSVVLSLLILTLSLLVLMGIMHVGISNFFSSLKNALKWFFSGVLGSLCAIFFVYVVIYPVKFLSPIWQWPDYSWHFLITIFSGLIGWVFYQWKKS
jgi:cell division protein FtsX